MSFIQIKQLCIVIDDGVTKTEKTIDLDGAPTFGHIFNTVNDVTKNSDQVTSDADEKKGAWHVTSDAGRYVASSTWVEVSSLLYGVPK